MMIVVLSDVGKRSRTLETLLNLVCLRPGEKPIGDRAFVLGRRVARRNQRLEFIDPVRYEALKFGGSAVGSTPEELAVLLEAEMEKWRPVIKEANIALD
jgi:hypothetical protein